MTRVYGTTAMPAGMEGRRENPDSETPLALDVALYERGDFDAANWPSLACRPDLEMNVFQAREFLEPWIQTVGETRRARPYLVVVRDRSRRPVLYLPLVLEPHLNASLLRFPDAGLSDLNAPIVAGNRSVTATEFVAIWSEILGKLPPIDVIDFQKMPPTINGRRNPLTYLPCTADATCGFEIDLGSLYGEVHLRPSIARVRKKLQRQFRRLAEQGPAEFIVNPSGRRLEAIVDALFALKREQFLRTYRRDLLAVPGVEQFYRRVVLPGLLGRTTHLSALLCGGTVVSAHLGFISRKRFHYVMPAYDTRFRSLAPGHMLLDHLITRCTEDEFATFDLGEGNFAYKHKWATQRIALSRHEFAVTMRGRIYLEARRWHRRLVAHAAQKRGHPERSVKP